MKYTLVLGGGGAKGSYEIGVYKAVTQLGHNIDAVCGTSIGAINGALIAQGDWRLAEELWRGIRLSDIVTLPDKIAEEDNIVGAKTIIPIIEKIRESGSLDMNPLEDLLRKCLDEDRLRSSPTDFGLVTYSLSKKEERALWKKDIPNGKMLDYIMASAALVGFKPRVIDGEEFVDGGAVNNVPLDMAAKRGAENIIRVNVKAAGIKKKYFVPGANVISIEPSEDRQGIMDFDASAVSESMSAGYLDTMKAFGRAAGRVYYFDSEDYIKMRGRYSDYLIDGAETAARLLGIECMDIITVNSLVDMVLEKYLEKYAEYQSLGAVKRIFKLDDEFMLCRVCDALSGGGTDFLKKGIAADILKSLYSAANAVLYFTSVRGA